MEYISTNDDLIIKGKLFLEALGSSLGLSENDDVVSCLLKLQSDIVNVSNMININHAELVEIRNSGSLIPGRQYRIIDYMTTTTQAAKEYNNCHISNTQSAGHQFDIIVTADSTNKLNENAKAIQHEGDDTYFNNSNLAAWELKYCLDNDINRFGWADVDNGTGVIYYMKDEFDNECSYDFKNIQFRRKLDENDLYVPENGTTNDSSDEPILEWCYTFGGHLYDSSLSINENFKTFKNNVIGSFNFDNKFWLPDNVFLDSNEGITEYNILHDNCICNTFSYNNTYNELGMCCQNNIFNHDCCSNILKNNCWDNIFGAKCSDNVFDDKCCENTFGSTCQYNTFGSVCSINTFGSLCNRNTFGSGCSRNTFGSTCQYNTFGSVCSINTFGSQCSCNTFSSLCSINTFGSTCQYNTFGSGCSNNTFILQCKYNTFGGRCSYNRLYGNSNRNRFGNNCSNNIFGECCIKNILEESCNYINFISGMDGDRYIGYYENITVGQGNEYMSLQCTSTSISMDSPFRNVRITPGCCSGQINPITNKLTHLDILNGLKLYIDRGDGTSTVIFVKTTCGQQISTVIGKILKSVREAGTINTVTELTATMGV